MPDREKVANGLRHCLPDECTRECPYINDSDCTRSLMQDALFLLKEQEEKLAMMRMIYGTDAKVVGEIIRCKDCKHGKHCNDGEVNCEKDIGTFKTTVHEPDWFCADGERS